MRRITRIERERFWSLLFARGGGIDGIIIIVKKKKKSIATNPLLRE